jgi:hypothetical protein
MVANESIPLPDTPTDTDSAPTVAPKFLFGPSEVGESLRKKCSDCGPAIHEWYMQTVVTPEDPTGMSTANLHKRIVICTNCGKVSVTK